MMGLRRGWSIARQIGLLIFVALFLLTAANFLVTFAGPPPRPAPVQLADLVSILRGNSPDARLGARLRIDDGAADFATRDGEARLPDAESRLAQALGVDGARVRVASSEQLPPGLSGNSLVGAFSTGVRTGSGTWRIVRSAPQPLLTQWHRTTIAVTLGLTLLLGLIAAWISKGIVRPIQRLAREADQAYLDGQRGDITVDGPPEIAHLAGTIAAMRDRFAAMVESRTMMLAAISHDMATPLARLEFHVAKLPPDVRTQAEADMSELSALIASILGYAKGQQQLERRPVALTALVRDLVERYSRPDAPILLERVPQEAWVAGDRLALQRLLGNLIGNAQRYAGGGRIEIDLVDGRVTLSLIDAGLGFDPELAEQLFEPFFRIEGSRSRETAGAGLGLATARSIAEAHGGAITASSVPGEGARFVLMLPALDRDVA